jgi:hypothetical protein
VHVYHTASSTANRISTGKMEVSECAFIATYE